MPSAPSPHRRALERSPGAGAARRDPMIRDLILEAGGLVRFVLGGALCAVWSAVTIAFNSSIWRCRSAIVRA